MKLWDGVTQAIMSKQYSKATNIKVELEENQREKARERERTNEPFVPVFFTQATNKGGKPDLTEKGHEVLARAQKGEWDLQGII